MKAFIVERYGGGDALRLGDMPEPELRDDDVLVRVHAAGVNPLDAKIRDGEFKLILPYRLPLILGNDVAGVVTRVGPRVQRFKPGDEVHARPHHIESAPSRTSSQSTRTMSQSSRGGSPWKKRLPSPWSV